MNELSGDYLGVHFQHQTRETSGGIDITESNVEVAHLSLDASQPEILLAAVTAAVRRWKQRRDGEQSRHSKPGHEAPGADEPGEASDEHQ